jgi:bifunctional DNA-binding transcriptional regulator/antitoxin component of YhaV-PrlF toxin-antitoxin module
MNVKPLDHALTSTVTGKLQTTIPARLARKRGIKTGMRLEWIESGDNRVITARILPDLMTGLREAQSIAAENKEAAAKLMSEFEAERAWQREHGPTV